MLKEELAKQEAVFETLQAEVKQLRAQVKEKQQALSLHNENVEEKIEQLKSDYFELLNSQASIRNELQLLDDQMSQSAVVLQRLADSNEKHLQERRDISAQKQHVKRSLPESSRKFTAKLVHIVICRQNMSRKSANTKK